MIHSQELWEAENSLLAQLVGKEDKLVVATDKDLSPGVAIYYKLVDTWGVHILRSADQAQGSYHPDTDIRGGTKAGLFYILPLPL